MLPSYIRKQPKFWKHLPILSRQDGSTILGTIYFKEHIYENLRTKNPKPQYIGFLLHEETHRSRIQRIGKIRFGIKYFFSRKFRFTEELEANRVQMAYLKKNKVEVDLDRRAKILSSYLYFWPVSYDYAKKQLQKVWQDLV